MKKRPYACRVSPRQPGDSYTMNEAARALRIGRRTLERLVADGLIGHYRIGRRYAFTDEHLNEYRASVEVPRTAFPMRRIA